MKTLTEPQVRKLYDYIKDFKGKVNFVYENDVFSVKGPITLDPPWYNSHQDLYIRSCDYFSYSESDLVVKFKNKKMLDDFSDFFGVSESIDCCPNEVEYIDAFIKKTTDDLERSWKACNGGKVDIALQGVLTKTGKLVPFDVFYKAYKVAASGEARKYVYVNGIKMCKDDLERALVTLANQK